MLGSTALEEDGREDKTPLHSGFLMEILETREALEQCTSEDEAEAILAETKVSVDKCLRGMDVVLKSDGDKEDLIDFAVRLRYLYRIEDEARRVLHVLEDARARP